MVVVPTRMTVEHPEDLVSWFVEPSVKARKWVSEGGSGVKGEGAGGGGGGLVKLCEDGVEAVGEGWSTDGEVGQAVE